MATTVTISGTLKDAEGANLSGTITFRPSSPFYDLSGNLVVGTTPVIATLATGAFSQSLYATDDATTTAADATYTVTEALTGADGSAIRRTYKVEVPSASATIRYEDLVEVESAPRYSYATEAALLAHTGDTADAHDASAISVTALAWSDATDVQGALADVADAADVGTVNTVAASRDLASTDVSDTLSVTGPVTLTIPDGISTDDWRVNESCRVVMANSSTCSLAVSGSQSIRCYNLRDLSGEGAAATITRLTSTVWLVTMEAGAKSVPADSIVTSNSPLSGLVLDGGGSWVDPLDGMPTALDVTIRTTPGTDADRITYGTDFRIVSLSDVNSTGLTSGQLDALWDSTPPNGAMMRDDTNDLVLIRQGGSWRKIATVAL